MKRHLSILLLLLLSITVFTAIAGKDAQPEISMERQTHDFGIIKEADGKVTCQFEFVNKGKAPLIIISAVAGCGCTVPQYDEEPIAPGGKSAIRVSYNPTGRPGEFDKTIKVRTNDPKHRKLTLRIKGTVLPEK